MGSIFWFITFLILLILELMTVNLVTVWFMTGAFFAFAVSLFIRNLFLEVFVFILISAFMLITMKRFLSRIGRKEKVSFNSERVIGQSGLVVEDITKYSPGQVKVLGSVWSAVSENEILKGSEVEVLSIDGVKVVVEEIS